MEKLLPIPFLLLGTAYAEPGFGYNKEGVIFYLIIIAFMGLAVGIPRLVKFIRRRIGTRRASMQPTDAAGSLPGAEDPFFSDD